MTALPASRAVIAGRRRAAKLRSLPRTSGSLPRMTWDPGQDRLSGMHQNPTQVLVAGGGVAGLEALLALRALAGARVRLSLLAPEPDFVYRPLQTAEPFSAGHVTRRP